MSELALIYRSDRSGGNSILTYLQHIWLPQAPRNLCLCLFEDSMGCAASRSAVLAEEPRTIGKAGINKAQPRQVQQQEKKQNQFTKGKQTVSHQAGGSDPRGHGTAPVLFGSETTTSVQSFTIAASGALMCPNQIEYFTVKLRLRGFGCPPRLNYKKLCTCTSINPAWFAVSVWHHLLRMRGMLQERPPILILRVSTCSIAALNVS